MLKVYEANGRFIHLEGNVLTEYSERNSKILSFVYSVSDLISRFFSIFIISNLFYILCGLTAYIIVESSNETEFVSTFSQLIWGLIITFFTLLTLLLLITFCVLISLPKSTIEVDNIHHRVENFSAASAKDVVDIFDSAIALKKLSEKNNDAKKLLEETSTDLPVFVDLEEKAMSINEQYQKSNAHHDVLVSQLKEKLENEVSDEKRKAQEAEKLAQEAKVMKFLAS